MSGRNALCVCPKGVEIVAKLNNKVLPCTDLSKKFEILLEIYNNKKNHACSSKPLQPHRHEHICIRMEREV